MARPKVSGSDTVAEIHRVAAVPMAIWKASLSLPGRPLELRRVSFSQSSPKPMAPKPMVTRSTAQTSGFRRLAPSRVEQLSTNQVHRPPLVGVPLFVRRNTQGEARETVCHEGVTPVGA